jgi:hypothetical protein
VPVTDLGPRADLYDGLEFHPPWMQDSLDPVSWGGGDAQMSQQSLKPASGDRSFSLNDSISSASLYSFSLSVSLRGEYSSSSLSSLLTSWSSYYSSTGAPWATGLLGTTTSISKGSSSKDACSCVWCSEEEPSII